MAKKGDNGNAGVVLAVLGLLLIMGGGNGDGDGGGDGDVNFVPAFNGDPALTVTHIPTTPQLAFLPAFNGTPVLTVTLL